MRLLFAQDNSDLTLTQRWSTYITILLAIAMLATGINLQSSILFRTTLYQDSSTGIRAQYPSNWLIDTSPPDYIFRVRDLQHVGYKTTIQVSIIPTGPTTTARNIADQLALSRAQTSTDYRQLSVTPFTLFDEENAQSVLYTFVSRETSPFTESIPVVVIGNDIILRTREQALVITFRADTDHYDSQYPIFERFLNTLEF
jgi:hypothetical protein